MFLMWIGQNFPTRADITWFKMGGGMGKGSAHAPAWKFNAGQKLLYWFIVLGGAAMMISGFMLIFPFFGGLTVGDMQLAQIFHGVVGMLFIALILAHIYLGTLGMERGVQVDGRWHGRLQLGQGAPSALARRGDGAGPRRQGRGAGHVPRPLNRRLGFLM